MFLFPSPPRIDLIFLYPRNHQNRAYFFVINSIRPVSQIYVQVDTYFIMPLLSCLLCGRGGFKTGHGLLMHQKTNQNCVALQNASQFLGVNISVLNRPPDDDPENNNERAGTRRSSRLAADAPSGVSADVTEGMNELLEMLEAMESSIGTTRACSIVLAVLEYHSSTLLRVQTTATVLFSKYGVLTLYSTVIHTPHSNPVITGISIVLYCMYYTCISGFSTVGGLQSSSKSGHKFPLSRLHILL